MNENQKTVTMNGNPLNLVGDSVTLDSPIPDATLLDNELQPVNLTDYRGRIVILSSVPSLDTPVCDMQTRRFNTEAARLGEEVSILTISMDLPFAQKRWCGAAGVDRVITLSDHRTAQFGLRFGLLIEELRLLARAVMVVDREGVLRYRQLVGEITSEPDYATALEATKLLLNS